MLSFFYVLVALPISEAAQERKVSAKLWEEVRSAGTVRISQESFRNLSREDHIYCFFTFSTVSRRRYPQDLAGARVGE